MLKKIFALSVLCAIILLTLAGAVNADHEMLTYTNEGYGFSIDCPDDWIVIEGYKAGVITFLRPKEEGFLINGNVVIEELLIKLTAEEYAKASIELFLEYGYDIVKTFNDTINGEPVSGYIVTSTIEGIEIKQMQACFVNGTTAYVITFSAASSTYDEAEADYFDPMLHSFKFPGDRDIEIGNSNYVLSKEAQQYLTIVERSSYEKSKSVIIIEEPHYELEAQYNLYKGLEIVFNDNPALVNKTIFLSECFPSGKHISVKPLINVNASPSEELIRAVLSSFLITGYIGLSGNTQKIFQLSEQKIRSYMTLAQDYGWKHKRKKEMMRF